MSSPLGPKREEPAAAHRHGATERRGGAPEWRHRHRRQHGEGRTSGCWELLVFHLPSWSELHPQRSKVTHSPCIFRRLTNAPHHPLVAVVQWGHTSQSAPSTWPPSSRVRPWGQRPHVKGLSRDADGPTACQTLTFWRQISPRFEERLC